MLQDCLLHHCCAVCTPYVFTALSDKYNVVSYWYNPNIYPDNEKENRKNALISYLTEYEIAFVCEDFDYDGFFATITQGLTRCEHCYLTRINKTVNKAKELKIKNFSTTLLASPYQQHDFIKQYALKAAHENGLNFIYSDFRPAFYKGKNIIKEKKLYSQKYCGCGISYGDYLIRKENKWETSKIK